MRIALYSHNIDFAGTWRSHERIAEVLQLIPGLSIDILYSRDVENNRLDVAMKVLHKCEFVPFHRSVKKTGPENGYAPISTDIDDVINDRNIDIIHFARSGYYEWPFNKRIAPVQVETNIFGYKDNSGFLDGSVVIARCLGLPENSTSILVPNPIPSPTPSYEHIPGLRGELGIDEDALVFGRIGRPANFSPIALESFAEFRKTQNSKYLVIGPCNDTKLFVKQRSIQDDVVFLDCTNDDHLIERFHKTIDVFAHYRADGEICSTSISQAMMYGIPVITHTAGLNGQIEWLGDGGIHARNSQEYFQAMCSLADKNTYDVFSKNASAFARSNFDQKNVSLKILHFYKHLMNTRGMT